MRYPHIFGCCCGILILGFPFVVRTVCPAYEIYPSIVLPARATLLDVKEGDYQIKAYQFVGTQKESGKEIVLDDVNFMSPIPIQLKGVLASSKFRVEPNYKRQIYFKYLPIEDRFNMEISRSNDDRIETKNWISKKLEEANCKSDEFILRSVLYEVKKRELISQNPVIIDEERIRLD